GQISQKRGPFGPGVFFRSTCRRQPHQSRGSVWPPLGAGFRGRILLTDAVGLRPGRPEEHTQPGLCAASAAPRNTGSSVAVYRGPFGLRSGLGRVGGPLRTLWAAVPRSGGRCVPLALPFQFVGYCGPFRDTPPCPRLVVTRARFVWTCFFRVCG